MGARRRETSPGHRWVTGLLALAVALVLSSCDAPMGDYHDPDADLTRQDFQNMLGSSNFVAGQPEAEAPPIPDLVPTLVAPVPPSTAEDRLVSISVTDSVPVRSVLLELARSAEVDLELDPAIPRSRDPAIQGGIIFTAHNRPFIEVIERIANLANLRYSFKNGVLRVELDRAYHRTYRIDQIASLRNSTSQIDISTDVFSSVGDSQINNGSAATISQSSTGDFYTELESNVRQILTNSSPIVMVQEVQLAAVDVTGDAAVTGTALVTENFSVHRQGGLLSVYATQRQHRLIQDYLLELMEQVGSQVLEAKVLEVNLNDEFRSGIEWPAVADMLRGSVEAAVSTGTTLFAAGGDVVGVTYGGTDVSGVLRLISQFGTTRTLANPRLTIGNNQPAVLKVAQNKVYFTVTFDVETTEFGQTRTFESTLNTVPVGLVMIVQPSINLVEDRVTMSLRPTLSRIIGFVDDPAVALASDNEVTSQVPITEVREMDSVVSARSGEVVIMGGLMQEVSANATSGVPGFQEIPWVGNLFKANDRDREVIELVIFLKATIVPAPVPDPADIDLYATFSIDPRPLTF